MKWAGGWNIIPSRSAGDKAPAVKFNQYNGPSARAQTQAEQGRYAITADIDGGVPLLLLDHWLPGRSLCVVDVDDMSRWDEVVLWFGERGVDLTAAYIVETGRDGGGRQCYFLREHGRESRYRQQIDARAFGGKALDMKAGGNYVVAPGAIHKTGRIYTGNWPGTLASLVDRLPVMPLSVWREANRGHHAAAVATATPVLSIDDGPEWAEVVAAGGVRQNRCPWCGSVSARVLAYDVGHGAAHCFKEGVTRRLHRNSEPGVATSSIVQKTGTIREARVRSPEEAEAFELFGATCRYLDILTAPVLQQDAEQAATERWILEHVFGEPMPLGVLAESVSTLVNRLKPPTGEDLELGAAVEQYSSACAHLGYCYGAGVSKVTAGKLTRLPCKRYTCGICGPRQMAATRASARVVFNRPCYRDWNVATADVTNENRGSVMKHLERWQGLYESVATEPGRETVILLWAPGTVPPPFTHTVKTDVSGEFDDAMEAVNIVAWENHVGRVRIVKGRRELATAISTLRDQVLGIKPLMTDEGAHKMRTPHALTFLGRNKIEEYMASYLDDPEFKYVRTPHPPSDLPQPTEKFTTKTKASPADEEAAIVAGRKSGALPDTRDRRANEQVDYSQVEDLGFDAPTHRRRA